MDRRTILAIMLCLTLFYVWSFATGAGQLPTETDTDASEDAVVDAQQPHAEPPETSVIPAATPPAGSDPNPMDTTDESIEVKEIPYDHELIPGSEDFKRKNLELIAESKARIFLLVLENR